MGPESWLISKNIDLDSESYEYDSDYYDYNNSDFELECRAESTGLLRRGHDLKHGSNQEKYIAPRPKILVKYGKCDVPSSTNDIDKETQTILDDAVHKYTYFSVINGAIRSGERAVLLHCYGHQPPDKSKPQEFLLKVYRLQFGMERIKKWALNEYVNAWYMFKHANVPNMYAPTKNVIAMNFIGDDGKPAPSLNDVTFEITEKIYFDVITSMYKLYHYAKRVHGKLSARTILWWRNKLYFISLSSAVESSQPNALQLLMKDCCHVTHFFKSKGLVKVKSIMNLFKWITGLEPNKSVLLVLKHTRKPVKHKQKKKLL